MSARSLALVTVAVAFVAGACDRSTEPRPTGGPPRCDPHLSVPGGFETTGSIQDPSPDRVGVRVDLRASDGRELHYFAGIRGEFGEGLADRGPLRLADGDTGRLAGGDATWVLEWEGRAPCSPSVVLGTGMDAAGFRDLLREAGALPVR